MKSRNSKSLTVADLQRFDNLVDLGCIACILDGKLEPFKIDSGYRPQVHHMDGWVKPDCHKKTVPLCYWHHKGESEPFSTKSASLLFAEMGPSYHKHKRLFRITYGSDAELIETVNKYLGET